jgi:hypothetical protein
MQYLSSLEDIIAEIDVKRLPKWKLEYDDVIQKAETDARDYLLTHNVPKPFVDALVNNGGVIEFAGSNLPAGKDSNGKDFLNPDGTQMSRAKWFETRILPKLTELQKHEFAALTTTAMSKQKEKTGAMESASKNAKTTLAEERAKANDTFSKAANQALGKLREEYLPKLGFPVEKPTIMASDSTTEKASKQKNIDVWDRVEKRLNSDAKTAHDVMDIRFLHAIFPELMSRLTDVEGKLAAETKRADSAEERWKGIKDARRLGSKTVLTPRTETDKRMIDDESTAADRVMAWRDRK